MSNPTAERGFTLVELLVVLVILAILAAVAFPRFLETQREARDAVVVTDLRNLIIVETSLEASTGLSDDPDVIAARGWEGSDARVRVCAELLGSGQDITLTAWHLDGRLVYSYTRSAGVLQSNEVPVEQTCAAQVGLGAETVWPRP